MPEYGDEQTISELVQELDRGASVVFDSGHHDGSITVRSKVADRIGQPPSEFTVRDVTNGGSLFLSADEAQREVGRRRRLRDGVGD